MRSACCIVSWSRSVAQTFNLSLITCTAASFLVVEPSVENAAGVLELACEASRRSPLAFLPVAWGDGGQAENAAGASRTCLRSKQALPHRDSNPDLLVQSQVCCRLHHSGMWFRSNLGSSDAEGEGIEPVKGVRSFRSRISGGGV